MNKKLFLEIITPENVIFSEKVLSVVIPAADGQATILADHTAYITNLTAGKIIVNDGYSSHIYINYGGFAQFINNTLTLLIDEIHKFVEKDHEELNSKIKEAKENLENATTMHDKNYHEDFLSQLTRLQHCLNN